MPTATSDGTVLSYKVRDTSKLGFELKPRVFRQSFGLIPSYVIENPLLGLRIYGAIGSETEVTYGFRKGHDGDTVREEETGFYWISAGSVGYSSSGTLKWAFSSSDGHKSYTHLVPDTTRTHTLGTALLEWDGVFSRTATVSGLTVDRVLLAGVGGLLSDSAALTFISNALGVGTASTTTGTLKLYHASSANVGTVTPPNWGGNRTLTLPDVTGTLESQANKDTASGYAGLNSSSRITKGADTTDDLIVDNSSKGLVLKDSAGTPHYWRVTVSAAGALVITDLGTTKP